MEEQPPNESACTFCNFDLSERGLVAVSKQRDMEEADSDSDTWIFCSFMHVELWLVDQRMTDA